MHGQKLKSSNDQKIARMARILTIFGPKRSQRPKLFHEKFSNERNERKVPEKFEKLSIFFSKNSQNRYCRRHQLLRNAVKNDLGIYLAWLLLQEYRMVSSRVSPRRTTRKCSLLLLLYCFFFNYLFYFVFYLFFFFNLFFLTMRTCSFGQ